MEIIQVSFWFIIPLYANKVNCAILLIKSKEKGYYSWHYPAFGIMSNRTKQKGIIWISLSTDIEINYLYLNVLFVFCSMTRTVGGTCS